MKHEKKTQRKKDTYIKSTKKKQNIAIADNDAVFTAATWLKLTNGEMVTSMDWKKGNKNKRWTPEWRFKFFFLLFSSLLFENLCAHQHTHTMLWLHFNYSSFIPFKRMYEYLSIWVVRVRVHTHTHYISKIKCLEWLEIENTKAYKFCDVSGFQSLNILCLTIHIYSNANAFLCKIKTLDPIQSRTLKNKKKKKSR